MIAFAGDLDLSATRSLAVIAAVPFVFGNRTRARFVCAGVSFFVSHSLLLPQIAPLRSRRYSLAPWAERGLSLTDLTVGKTPKIHEKGAEEKLHTEDKFAQALRLRDESKP